MSRQDKLFSAGGMVVVGVLTSLGSVLMIGWYSRGVLDEMRISAAASVAAVNLKIDQHTALDDTRVLDLKDRVDREEKQLAICCPVTPRKN